MASPAETPTVPAHPAEAEFDLLEFWIRHKQKVIFYGGSAVAAFVIFLGYTQVQAQKVANSERALSDAKSQQELKKVADEYSGTAAAASALLLLAEKQRTEAKYEEAIATLRTFISKNAGHPLLSGAHLSIASTLESQGKLDEALNAYKTVTTSYPGSYSAPAAWVAQGRILKGQGKIDDARRAFETGASSAPQSFFSQEATRQIERLKQ